MKILVINLIVMIVVPVVLAIVGVGLAKLIGWLAQTPTHNPEGRFPAF